MKTKLQQWGLALVALGAASFILPTAGMQLRIFNLFGGASPAVSIGVVILGGVLWLVGTGLGAAARTQKPRPRPVTGSPAPPPVTPAMSSRIITKCPKCGQSVAPSDRFCMECGSPVPQTTVAPPVIERPKRPSGRHPGVWVLLGFFFAAVMAVILAAAIAVWLTVSGWRLTPGKTAAASPAATPAETYFNQGASEAQRGDFQKAIADYTEALRLKPDYVDAYYNRGTTFMSLKQYDKALSDLTKVIQLKPSYVDAFTNRGLTYMNLNQSGNAISDFTEAIRLKPDSAIAYLIRGNALVTLKQYDKAVSDFSSAIKIDPKYVDAYFDRGNIYSALKEYDKAIGDFSSAIMIRQDPQFYRNRGFAYQMSGQAQQAAHDFQKAQELASGH